jgi:hypothetical protein
MRLLAIVDRLPKTADGVTVVPGDGTIEAVTHTFDVWMELFEQFVAGQAEKARQQ